MQHYEMVEETATFAAGVFTLGGAIAGRLAWADTTANTGDQVYYRAQTADGSEWEVGLGTYNRTSATLTRNGYSSRATGFGGAFTGPVQIAQVVPATNQIVAIDVAEPRATAYQSCALAAGIAQADNSFAMMGGASTHEGAAVAGFSASSFAPYVDQFYGAFRWNGTADTYSSQQTQPLEDYGGNVLIVEEYGVAVVHGVVIAMRDDDQAVYAAEIRAAIAYPGGGSLALVGTPTVTEIAKSAGVTVSASVSAANGGLTITANGNTQYWRWSAALSGTGF